MSDSIFLNGVPKYEKMYLNTGRVIITYPDGTREELIPANEISTVEVIVEGHAMAAVTRLLQGEVMIQQRSGGERIKDLIIPGQTLELIGNVGTITYETLPE